MPRKGKRSQAQKRRWLKEDLTGQATIGNGVAQSSGGEQAEDVDNTPRMHSLRASHCQSDASSSEDQWQVQRRRERARASGPQRMHKNSVASSARKQAVRAAGGVSEKHTNTKKA
ncbi:replicase helicase endonuclease, partial [Clarias magur]